MSDLTTEYYYHCISAEHFEIEVQGAKDKYIVTYGKMPINHIYQYDWTCSCKGFKFKNKCKHIDIAKKKHCGWYQFTDGGEPVNNKCPECGNEVKSQGYGV